MCRVFAYLGDPLLLDGPLFEAEDSLIDQTVNARLMKRLNIGGFGVAAWNSESVEPDRPFFYKTPNVPVFDRNLKALAEKVHASAVISHVRGVVYDPTEQVGPQNLHPFRFPGAQVVMAQNGDLYDFAHMKFELLKRIPDEIARHVEGTTDTEWVYATVLSHLDDPWGKATADQLADAVVETIKTIRSVRDKLGLRTQSPVNLVVSDGDSLVATRFCFDYGWYPDDDSFFADERQFDYTTLWLALGKSFDDTDGDWRMHFNEELKFGAAMVASEPIGADPLHWTEVPEYSMLVIERGDDSLSLRVQELNL
jgi:glutamine amidotransferase